MFETLCRFSVTKTFHACNGYKKQFYLLPKTRRYGPLRGPTFSSCGGLRPLAKVFFCPLGKKIDYYADLAHFRSFLVSSSNLCNFLK